MKTDITMFCDASVKRETNATGWGCWIKGDGRDSISAGGPLREFNSDVAACELMAIANGLSHAAGSGYFMGTDKTILIQSDCTIALSCLRKARPSITVSDHKDSADVPIRRKDMLDGQYAATKHILSVVDQCGLTVIIRHVRGHKGGGGRNYVNRLCDRLANEGRLEAEKRNRKSKSENNGNDETGRSKPLELVAGSAG